MLPVLAGLVSGVLTLATGRLLDELTCTRGSGLEEEKEGVEFCGATRLCSFPALLLMISTDCTC